MGQIIIYMKSDKIEQLVGPNDRNFEQELRDITLAPYIAKARALIGIPGKGGANLFRHQQHCSRQDGVELLLKCPGALIR